MRQNRCRSTAETVQRLDEARRIAANCLGKQPICCAAAGFAVVDDQQGNI
jgi:hypothetical protein